MKLRPDESVVVEVRLVGDVVGGEERGALSSTEMMLLETDKQLGSKTGASISSSLVQSSTGGVARVLISKSGRKPRET